MASIIFDAMNKMMKKLYEAPYHPPTYYVSPTSYEWMRRYLEVPMPGYFDNVNVTVDGLQLNVQSVDVSVEHGMCGTKYSIEGFVGDEQRISSGYSRRPPGAINMIEYGRPGRGKTMGGAGIGVAAEDFLSQPIGQSKYYIYETENRGEKNMREGTQGSYAYGVAQLAEGLKSAVDSGYITADEAKTEFRLNVASVARADELAAYEKERIETLEKELEKLREKQAETS